MVGAKRRLTIDLELHIKALKDVFQVCEFSREADEIVHQMWWYTDDAVWTSPIARGRQMTSPNTTPCPPDSA